MTNSAAPSKFNRPGRPKSHRWLVIFLVLVALGLTLGPSLILNVALTAFPKIGEGTLSYSQARAGFLFREVSFSELAYSSAGAEPWHLTVEETRLEGLSVISILRWWLAPSDQPGPLTKRVSLQNFNLRNSTQSFSLDHLELTNPTCLSPAQGGRLPLAFSSFRVKNFAGLWAQGQLGLSKISVGQLGPEILDELTLEGFTLNYPDNQVELSLESLSLAQVRVAELTELLEGASPQKNWRFLMQLYHLKLKKAVFIREGQREVYLDTALFETKVQKKSVPASFRRYINFTVFPNKQTQNQLENILGFKITEITGPQLSGELKLAWTHSTEPDGQTNIHQASLNLSELGELNFTAKLQGLQYFNPGLTPSQLLFTALVWKLEGLSLQYLDLGLAAKLYPWLRKNTFPFEPGTTAQIIQRRYLQPWLAELQNEAGLADLPALNRAIEDFLDRPESILLTASPNQLFALVGLAKLDKYDIIEKLGLSLTVNQNRPILVTVATGVTPDQQGLSPKPIDSLFTEEDI